MKPSIAIVIPTRNRPREAMNAVESLVSQGPEIEIFLCDNSTSPRRLEAFSRRFPQVTYLRPSTEVAMGRNWDWAMREAMRLSSATHLAVHYDRKHSKPGAWATLADIAAAYPDTLISYPVDHIGHVPPPLRLWQPPWTGKLFAVSTRRVASLVASGCVTEISHALPVFSNCLVPRRILEDVLERFGTVCDSIAPDGAFMCRFFASEEQYLHFDKPLGILYSSRRSNGLGYLRGKGGDYPDFVRLSDQGNWLHAAPIPGLSLGNNMLFHEYELVRRTTGDRLPPFDWGGVLKDLGHALRWTAEPELAARFAAALRTEGWDGNMPDPLPIQTPAEAKHQRAVRLRMFWRGHVPDMITGFSFRNDRQALRWAQRYPRTAQETFEHLALLEPQEVPGPA